MTSDEQELVRWCYLVAGFSRARLAADFETTIAEVETIVSSGLGEVLNSGGVREAEPKQHVYVMNAPLSVPQEKRLNVELCQRVMRALD